MRPRLLIALFILAGCGSEPTSEQPDYWSNPGVDGSIDPDASDPDAAFSDADLDAPDAPDLPSPEAGVDATEPVVTADVSHVREVRGAWIATVSRINWPSSNDAATQQAEMESILDAVQLAGLNTVFFQVRPEADALYASDLEPWSRYLTGTQGEDPGYDPLEFAIDGCHRRGLELHAWLNPYRARAGNVGESAPNHVINALPQAVVPYGALRWLDPGHPDAFDHTLSVIEDLLVRYDLDGLHFDDYFYPYPESGVTFDDAATYAAYGGGMSLGDWRRDNVNRMVGAVAASVHALRPDARWGISPFGIYRPGVPAGVVGLDQYAQLYADPVKWMEEGWVEYIAPQLYWPTTSSGQPYESLLAWWDERAVETGRTLLTGNSASSGYSLDEYRAEMNAMRDASDQARGAIWWSVGPIVENTGGLADVLSSEYYGQPAATPVLADAIDTPPSHPGVQMDQGTAHITTSANGIRFWAVYRENGGEWDIDQLVPSATSEFALSDGAWAISAIDRSGRESLGVVVEGEGTPEPEPSGASCTHSYGGVYADKACSASYQCCDGQWLTKNACGACLCVEETGEVGCGT
jgi:uncharacterized lipoprotein YddW (UPF0748 family)